MRTERFHDFIVQYSGSRDEPLTAPPTLRDIQGNSQQRGLAVFGGYN